MKLSLILSTIGRTTEVARFLESLATQQGEWELIVVDQNADERLQPVLSPFRGRFSIKHLRSARGLSRGRNAGLAAATGDLVAFPDDDCWYPEGLLERVERWFLSNPGQDGLTGISIDEHGRPSAGNWSSEPGPLDRFNVWRRGISFAIFLRADTVRKIETFDETLGVGAGTPWGSGEETDFLLRALESGARLQFDPSLAVHHPEPVTGDPEKAIQRAYSYGAGMGRVLSKHHYPAWFIGYQWLRPLGGTALAVLRRDPARARFYLASARGRIRGALSR